MKPAELQQAVRSELLDMVAQSKSRKADIQSGAGCGAWGYRLLDEGRLVRHDIVHRNRRSRSGEPVDIQLSQITELISKVRALAASIDKQSNPAPEAPPIPALDPDDVPF